MSQTQYREPIEFAAGDTLSFTRKLPDYLAGDGWSLTYELRGGAQAIEFSSTASGGDHAIAVTAAVTATWLPAEYILAGYAVKAAERHQVYLGTISITQNLPAATGDVPKKTFAALMVEKLEATMLAKAGDDLARSALNDTGFWYLTPEQLRVEHGYWKSVRVNEIKMERAKAGLPTGNKIRPSFNVVACGATGAIWRGF